jgi:hypothetical protein
MRKKEKKKKVYRITSFGYTNIPAISTRLSESLETQMISYQLCRGSIPRIPGYGRKYAPAVYSA